MSTAARVLSIDALAELRDAREAITDLLAVETTAARPTRPGVCPGDPPAPAVHSEATRVLCILELARTQPSLQPDGQLSLAHPEHVSPDLRAAARQHQADICALLDYRALLEQRWPISNASMQ